MLTLLKLLFFTLQSQKYSKQERNESIKENLILLSKKKKKKKREKRGGKREITQKCFLPEECVSSLSLCAVFLQTDFTAATKVFVNRFIGCMFYKKCTKICKYLSNTHLVQKDR